MKKLTKQKKKTSKPRDLSDEEIEAVTGGPIIGNDGGGGLS